MAKHYYELSTILQRLLFEKKMNASELARETGLPVPTVHRLVTGKSTRPYKSSLKPIADFFSLEVEQLIGEKPIPGWENDFNGTHEFKVNMIPIISWEGLLDLEKARQESIRKVAILGIVNASSFALVMQDYSMEPLFPKGTILIFDPDKLPNDRDFILVTMEQKKIPIFRQLVVDGAEKYLKAYNPDLRDNKVRLPLGRHRIFATLYESRVIHANEETHITE